MKALTIGQRLFGIIGLAVLVAAILTGLGLYGLSATKDSLKTVYLDRMVPIGNLDKISNLMVENRAILRTALSEVSIGSAGSDMVLVMDPEAATKAADAIEYNIATIGELWKAYMATYLTPEEKKLAENFAESRGKFVNEALKPAVTTMRAGNHIATKRYADQARSLFADAIADAYALSKIQFDIAQEEYNNAVTRYENTRLISFSSLGGAILILIWIGFSMTRTISRALGGEPDQINEAAARIAVGDLNFAVSLGANDRSSAMAAMNSLQRNIKLLVSDATLLAKAAVEGRLATRADATQHQGEFRAVVEGVNATLDSVIGPLNVAANYVDRISKGDIPAKITDTYNGDFNTIKNNLNQCIDAVNSMVEEAGNLEKAAIEGRLATRADASKYQGDFRKVVVGVNSCLDAVINPLNVAAKYVDDISKGNILKLLTPTTATLTPSRTTLISVLMQ